MHAKVVQTKSSRWYYEVFDKNQKVLVRSIDGFASETECIDAIGKIYPYFAAVIFPFKGEADEHR